MIEVCNPAATLPRGALPWPCGLGGVRCIPTGEHPMRSLMIAAVAALAFASAASADPATKDTGLGGQVSAPYYHKPHPASGPHCKRDERVCGRVCWPKLKRCPVF